MRIFSSVSLLSIQTNNLPTSADFKENIPKIINIMKAKQKLLLSIIFDTLTVLEFSL